MLCARHEIDRPAAGFAPALALALGLVIGIGLAAVPGTALAQTCADVTGNYVSAVPTCKVKGGVSTCKVKGIFEALNLGNVTSVKSTVNFYLSTDATLDIPGDTFLLGKKLKKVKTTKPRTIKFKGKLVPGASPTYQFVIADVDAAGTNAECDETNNTVLFGPLAGLLLTGTSLVSGPFPGGSASCPASSDYECLVVQVIGCTGVTSPATARLYIGPKIGTGPDLGTVTFQQGGRSSTLWEATLEPDNRKALDTLRQAGFRVIQIVWDLPGWNSDVPAAAYASSELTIACRPATVFQYIYENYVRGTGTPLCSLGSSSGAESIAYSLSEYGGSDWFSAVYLSGGPYGPRLDLGCTQTPLSGGGVCESQYGYQSGGLIDEGFGFPDSDDDGTPDCEEGSASTPTAQALQAWRGASLGYSSDGLCPDHGEYSFPNVYVSFRHGEFDSICSCAPGDCGNAPNHQQLYIDEMTNAVRGGATDCHPDQPFLDDKVVLGTGHTVNETPIGVADWLAWVYDTGTSTPNKCRIWP